MGARSSVGLKNGHVQHVTMMLVIFHAIDLYVQQKSIIGKIYACYITFHATFNIFPTYWIALFMSLALQYPTIIVV